MWSTWADCGSYFITMYVHVDSNNMRKKIDNKQKIKIKREN